MDSLFYRRAFGIDDEGIEVRGKRYCWSDVIGIKERNLFPGLVFTAVYGQPKATIKFNDGNFVHFYPSEFVEEGKKAKRDFFTGVSAAYKELEKIISSKNCQVATSSQMREKGWSKQA